MSIKPTYEELEQRVIDKMNYNQETIAGHGDKSLVTPRLIYMLIGVTGLIVIGILGYGFYTGDRMNRAYAPLVDAAMEIKLEATTAHLWFEEIISGDRYEDMATVWKHLDQAEWYAKAMLEGGKNQEETFIPLDDNKMRRAIIEVQGKLSEFRDITKQRIAAKETSGVGTAIDQRYDAIFNDFIIQADKVESRLQQVMARDMGRFRYTQVTLMVVCLLLFLTIGIVYYRWTRWTNRVLFNAQGKAVTYQSISEDIPARKQAEEELLENELFFSQTFKQSMTSMGLYNPEGTIIKVNHEFCRMFGVEKNVIIKQHYNLFEDQAISDAGIVPLLRSIFDEKVAKNWEIDFDINKASESTGTPTSESGKKFLEVFGYPVLDRNGNLECVVLQHYDITERKEAEDALRKSEERYRSLLENLNAGVVAHASDTSILFVNPTACKLLGLTESQMLGKEVIDPQWKFLRNDKSDMPLD